LTFPNPCSGYLDQCTKVLNFLRNEIALGRLSNLIVKDNIVMRRITTFRSTTDSIYDGGPVIL